MQGIFLWTIVSLVVIAVIALNLVNYYSAKRKAAARPQSSVATIHAMYFPQLERELFQQLWSELARSLNIDEKKLSPDDTIRGLVPSHLPELHIDKLEVALRKLGVKPGQVDMNMSVRDLVELIARLEHERS